MNAALRLKKNEDRRVRAGHLWIYSNEIDVKQTPLTHFMQGQAVSIESNQGQFIGNGYINPHSLICARITGRDPAQLLDKALLRERLQNALSLRQRLFPQPFYRLIFAESDLLPGLIVDRYNDVLVVQITTAGMETIKDLIRNALLEVIKPSAILLRNDSGIREMEGLPKLVEAWHGEPPSQVALIEHGSHFKVPIWAGQKTGWFFDQRYNRARLQHYVQGKRVLDVFSYIGAWSVQAAAWGATHVTAIDSSANALGWLEENAQLNKVQHKITPLQEDAFKALQQLREAGEKFDVIIVDPPAFMKRRKDIKAGLIAYKRLNELALRLLNNDGILISASCSMHLSRENLVALLQNAALTTQRDLQIIERGQQAPDHPVHPAIVETDYLKALIARKLAK